MVFINHAAEGCEDLFSGMFPVAIPAGPHPFPSRTRKVRPPRPMLLLPGGSGKVGRGRVTTRGLLEKSSRLFYFEVEEESEKRRVLPLASAAGFAPRPVWGPRCGRT